MNQFCQKAGNAMELPQLLVNWKRTVYHPSETRYGAVGRNAFHASSDEQLRGWDLHPDGRIGGLAVQSWKKSSSIVDSNIADAVPAMSWRADLFDENGDLHRAFRSPKPPLLWRIPGTFQAPCEATRRLDSSKRIR